MPKKIRTSERPLIRSTRKLPPARRLPSLQMNGADGFWRSEEPYRSVVAAMTEGMVLQTADGTIFDCNEQATRILGLTRNQILGKTSRDPCWQAIREDGSPFPGEEHPAMVALKSGRPSRQVVMGLHLPAGGRRWININAEPLFRAKDVRPHGVVVTFTDITERKQAEESLRKNQEQYLALFTNMQNGFAHCQMIFNRAGRAVDFLYLRVNSAFTRLTGLKNVVGRCVTEVIPGIRKAHPELFEIYGRVARTGQPEQFTVEFKPLALWLQITVYRPHPGHFAALFENVTERKRAEESQSRSEERFRAIAEFTPDIISIFDREGRIVFNSAAAKKIHGYQPGELENRPTFDLIHPDDRARVAVAFDRLLKKQAVSAKIQYRYRNANGSYKWMEAFAHNELANPHINGIIAISRDITERRQAELELRQANQTLDQRVVERTAALQASEERFRAIATNTRDLIFIQNRKLRYQLVINPQLGLTEADMLGKTDRELFKKAVAARLTALKMRVLKTGKPVHVDTSIPNLKGGLEYFEGDYIPQRDAAGKLIGLIGYFRNITKRKHVELALAEKESFLRNIYEHIGASIFVVNIHSGGKYTYAGWNAIGDKITGVKSEQALGRTPQEIFAPLEAKRICANYDRCVREGTIRYEESFLHRGKTIWSQTTLVSVLDETGRAKTIVGFASDITESKRITEALSKSEERYRRLFTNSRDALLTTEAPSWKMTSANPAAMEMFGARNVGQLLAANPWELSPMFQPNGLNSRLAAQAMIKRAMKEGSISFEWQHRRLDGAEYPASVLLTRIELGRKVFLQATVRDMSERVRLEQEVLSISDWERRRIAHDLHDGLGQLLVGASYLTDALKKEFPTKSEPIARRLQRIQEVLQSAVRQARNLASGVQPVEPEPNGLMIALDKLAEETHALFGVRCVFQCHPKVNLDAPQTATHLFRIAQESVTNAIKHGKAKRIVIRLTQNRRQITLTVTDNGLGLATTREHIAGMGMRIMRYRADLIGGILTIKNNFAGGASMTCRVGLVKGKKN